MITSFVFKALDRRAIWVIAVLVALAVLVPLLIVGVISVSSNTAISRRVPAAPCGALTRFPKSSPR